MLSCWRVHLRPSGISPERSCEAAAPHRFRLQVLAPLLLSLQRDGRALLSHAQSFLDRKTQRRHESTSFGNGLMDVLRIASDLHDNEEDR